MKKKEKIVYRGNVKIELIRGNKVYKKIDKKNAGRMPLFTFLTRCLAGYYDGNSAPKFLRAFSVEDITDIDFSTISEDEVTTAAIQVSGINLDSNTTNESGAVSFEFLIPASVLKVGSNDINVLAVYSTTNRTARSLPSAYITLEDADLISADGESNVKIVWTMTISNK